MCLQNTLVCGKNGKWQGQPERARLATGGGCLLHMPRMGIQLVGARAAVSRRLIFLRLADAPEVGIALAPGMRCPRPAAGVAGMMARISGMH
jgi:hypothetical protein